MPFSCIKTTNPCQSALESLEKSNQFHTQATKSLEESNRQLSLAVKQLHDAFAFAKAQMAGKTA